MYKINSTKMKKYVIMYADGREQTVMQAVHESREEAGRELMRYISYHNVDCDVDDYLSPFDFILKEIDIKDVNETITDFESAREALGTKPNADFYVVKRKHSEKVTHLEDAARLVTDINPKYIKALIALNELFTIAQAWNKEDEFVPDFSDKEQDKWFPLFKYNKDATGLVFAYSCSAWSCMLTDEYVVIVGSQLCFKSSERAAQFGKQFVDLYNKVFL